MGPSQTLINLDKADFGYGGRSVVCVEKLALARGSCLGIFGPNGSGKTTLVRGITGLLTPMAGHVVHEPHRGAVEQGTVAYQQPASMRIGYLPQHRNIELHWPMTALDAASLAISARRFFGWIGPRTKDVLNMMRRLKIDAFAHRPFASLSGGQQQRVLLAGALAGDPTVLVLDEPTEGLDVRSTQELLDLLRDFIAEGLATMIISHEADDLMQVAGEIAWLHPAAQYGDPSTVEIVTPEALGQRILQAARRVG
ncbi:MAG TPA: ATP-binding cassette domain-containing protein [Tepidisphaeraceae bacterium]